jgi:hypothetical protein
MAEHINLLFDDPCVKRTKPLYNLTEISEKGKPSERVGRKAMGSKVSQTAYDDSPAANISIILIYFLRLRGERNNGKEY